MGLMDGAMGGVMGGSMGAMLSVMVRFPDWAVLWTGVLLTVIYIAGMVGLVVLIEQSAPGHAALHRLAPFFTRAMATEADEADEAREEDRHATQAVQPTTYSADYGSNYGSSAVQAPARRLVDYYALLGVPKSAGQDEISEAYLEQLDSLDNEDDVTAQRLEKALAVLTNPQRRQNYDQKLAETQPQPKLQPQAQMALAASGAIVTNQITVRAQQQDNAGQQSQQGAITGRPSSSGRADQRPSQGGGPKPGSPQNGARSNGSGGSSGNTGGNANTNRSSGQGKSAQNGAQRNPAHNKASGQRPNNSNNSNSPNSKQAAQRQTAGYAQTQTTQVNLPVTWVGGLAFVVILLVVGWFVFSTGAARTGGGAPSGAVGASGETQAQLDRLAVIAPVGADGKQTIDVVLDSATFQYKPKAIKVKQGIPVHFNLSVINGDPG